MGKKAITESLREFVDGALSDGAIHQKHAEHILQHLNEEIASCLHGLHTVTDGMELRRHMKTRYKSAEDKVLKSEKERRNLGSIWQPVTPADPSLDADTTDAPSDAMEKPPYRTKTDIGENADS